MSYYSVLGLSENASLDECKRAYKKLCKIHHPDVGGDVKRFQEIINAWNMIQESSNVSHFHINGEVTHQSIFTFVRV